MYQKKRFMTFWKNIEKAASSNLEAKAGEKWKGPPRRQISSNPGGHAQVSAAGNNSKTQVSASRFPGIKKIFTNFRIWAEAKSEAVLETCRPRQVVTGCASGPETL
jgi:hypothetical protein